MLGTTQHPCHTRPSLSPDLPQVGLLPRQAVHSCVHRTVQRGQQQQAQQGQHAQWHAGAPQPNKAQQLLLVGRLKHVVCAGQPADVSCKRGQQVEAADNGDKGLGGCSRITQALVVGGSSHRPPVSSCCANLPAVQSQPGPAPAA